LPEDVDTWFVDWEIYDLQGERDAEIQRIFGKRKRQSMREIELELKKAYETFHG
jgi:hypothetical protein